MSATPLNNSPFGDSITAAAIVEDLEFFDSWEDRYRYLIDLGKKLTPLAETDKTEANYVHGCQSQVWLVGEYNAEQKRMYFGIESDAHIVRGLAAMVLAALNQQSPQAIMDFDMEAYFEQTQLIQHLSPTRGNGLRSMVTKIKQLAAAQIG